MRTLSWWAGIGVPLAAVAACADSAGQPTGKRPDQAPVPVVVAGATQQPLPVQLRAVGNVFAFATVSVKARVGGEIDRVHFKEGSEVRQGDPLFTIDPRPFQVVLDEANARLSRDRALLAQAEADVQRYTDLVKQEYVTKQQFDQAQANAAALRASVAVDEASSANAKLQLDYASIRAPISGRTGSLLVNAGNMVNPSDPKPLVVILQTRPVFVQFSVPGKHLNDIRAAAAQHKLRVMVTPAGQGATPITGQLDFVDNTVDATSGTIALKALFKNDDNALWPGQFVDVVLTLSEQQTALVVPSTAVQTGQQGTFIYVVTGEQTAVMRPVVVGRVQDDLTVIEQGIAAGDTVVVDGQLRLVPNAKVVIRSAAQASSRAAP
jgi:membrane fusion protein, multidrug efflux system